MLFELYTNTVHVYKTLNAFKTVLIVIKKFYHTGYKNACLIVPFFQILSRGLTTILSRLILSEDTTRIVSYCSIKENSAIAV